MSELGTSVPGREGGKERAQRMMETWQNKKSPLLKSMAIGTSKKKKDCNGL